MPKINVYLPEELAASVRAAGFPVSPVCQQALAETVRTVTAARKAIQAMRDPRFDPNRYPAYEERLANRMTVRLRRAVGLARQVSDPGTPTGTRHLLLGVLDEGDNLGLRVLQALEVDADELRAALEQAQPDEAETGQADAGEAGTGDAATGEAATGEADIGDAGAGGLAPVMRVLVGSAPVMRVLVREPMTGRCWPA